MRCLQALILKSCDSLPLLLVALSLVAAQLCADLGLRGLLMLFLVSALVYSNSHRTFHGAVAWSFCRGHVLSVLGWSACPSSRLVSTWRCWMSAWSILVLITLLGLVAAAGQFFSSVHWCARIHVAPPLICRMVVLPRPCFGYHWLARVLFVQTGEYWCWLPNLLVFVSGHKHSDSASKLSVLGA